MDIFVTQNVTKLFVNVHGRARCEASSSVRRVPHGELPVINSA